MPLPPAVQVFSLDAAKFLAGIDSMIAATDRLAAAIDQTAVAAERLSGFADSTAVAADRLAGAETAAGERAAVMTGAIDRMVVALDANAAAADRSVVATDRVAASYDKAGTSATVAGDKAAASGKKAGVFGGGMKTALLGVGGAMVYGVVKATQFQSQITQLHTQAGVTQDKLAGLSQGVLQLAGQVGEGPTSLAESLYHVASNMASLGASAPTMLNMVKTAAEGAQVGGANLVDVTNALTAAVASGIPGVQNFQQAMGALNATVGSGDMHMQDLADAFSTGLLAVVKGYGITLKDVGAGLATFGDNNIRGAKAGTDFRMAVQALAVPAASAKTQLAALGLTQTSLAKDMQSGGLMKALDDLTGRFKANGVTAKNEGEVITTLFGKKAGSGIAVLLEQMDRLKSKYPAITKAANGFADAWKSRQQTMAQQWDNLKSGAEALAVSFGTILLPVATQLTGAIAKLEPALTPVMQILGQLAGTVLGSLTGAVSAAGQAVQACAPALAMLGRALGAVFTAIGNSGVFRALASAITAVIVPLAQLISGLLGKLMPYLPPLFSAVSQVASALGGALGKAIASLLPVLSPLMVAIGQLAAGIGTGLARAIISLMPSLSQLVTALLKLAVQVITPLIGPLTQVALALVKILLAVTPLLPPILQLATLLVNLATAVLAPLATMLGVVVGWLAKLAGGISVAIGWLAGLGGRILGAIGNFGNLLFGAGKAVVQGLINGIGSMFGSIGSIAGQIGSSLLGGVKSVLGIGSPSKEFYLLGSYITQGLALGISETAARVQAAATRLAGQVTAAYGAGQITGSEENSLLARITTGLSSRLGSLTKVQAAIDYAKLGADITARLGSGMLETLPQAVRAARQLMASISRELSRGEISTSQADQLTLKIQAALTSRTQKLVKTMQTIGLQMAAGMMSSLENAASASQAKSAVDKLIGYVRTAWSAGDITTSRATAMTTWLEADNNRLQKLATQRQTLTATIKAAVTYANTTTSNTESWAGLSNVASSTTSGGMVYSGNLLAGMQANLTSINQFTAAIRKLGKLGLRKDLLDQIIQMGPAQGLQVAEAMINGPGKVISEMNQTQAQIASGSSALGQAAANAMYDTGAAAGKGFLSGLQAQEHQVTAMMNRVAVSMAATLKRELGIGGGGGGAGAQQVHVTVNGFVGSNAQLAEEIRQVMQQEILRYNKRNGKNGLSLSF